MRIDELTPFEKADLLYDHTKSEPQITFFDNVVTQMEVDTIDIKNNKPEELEKLCKNVCKEIAGADADFRWLLNADIHYPMVLQVKNDEYNAPFNAPENGYVISVCWSKSWSKIWGGEYITYHDTEPEDVISSFPGRVYISQGTAFSKFATPNVKAKQELIYLQFRVLR